MSTSTVHAPAPHRAGPVASLLLGVIHAYQRWVSPLFGPHCRFYPTCSSYAATAVAEHGALRGSWLAIRRLGRCHPWHPGGVDHVPAPNSKPGRSSRWAS